MASPMPTTHLDGFDGGEVAHHSAEHHLKSVDHWEQQTLRESLASHRKRAGQFHLAGALSCCGEPSR
eukprot:341201-Rhodomonas_salina.4